MVVMIAPCSTILEKVDELPMKKSRNKKILWNKSPRHFKHLAIEEKCLHCGGQLFLLHGGEKSLKVAKCRQCEEKQLVSL